MNYYDRLYNLILEERIEEAFWPKITEPIAPTFHADAVARRGGDAGKAWVTRMERLFKLEKGGGGAPDAPGAGGRESRISLPGDRTFWRNPLGKKIRTSRLGRVVRKLFTGTPSERPTYPPGYPYTPPKADL